VPLALAFPLPTDPLPKAPFIPEDVAGRVPLAAWGAAEDDAWPDGRVAGAEEGDCRVGALSAFSGDDMHAPMVNVFYGGVSGSGVVRCEVW
jgi:hypothetical protein